MHRIYWKYIGLEPWALSCLRINHCNIEVLQNKIAFLRRYSNDRLFIYTMVIAIEIVELEGALGHVTMGKHGNPKWYQQGGKKQNTKTKATMNN